MLLSKKIAFICSDEGDGGWVRLFHSLLRRVDAIDNLAAAGASIEEM